MNHGPRIAQAADRIGRRRAVPAVIAAIAIAGSLAACGSSDSSSTTAATGTAVAESTAPAAASTTASTTASAASGSSAVEAAKTFLAPHATDPVTWKGPDTSPPLAKGKHIVYLSVAPTNPAVQTLEKGAKEVAGVLGWKFTNINVQNQNLLPAVQQAVNLHPDGIYLSFSDPDTAAEAYKALGTSKIPVIANGVSTGYANFPGITHIVDVSYPLQGELSAAAAAKLSNGDAHLGVLTLKGGKSSAEEIAGIKGYFAEHGGGKLEGITYVDQGILFDPPKIGQAAVAFLQAHPQITQLFVVFDGVAAELAPAIKQAGLADKVSILSTEGDAINIAQIRSGGVQAADSVWPYAWASWAAFDDFNRIFNKVDPPADDGVPLREFTKDNLYEGDGYWNGDFDFRSKYKTLWGIK